MTTQVTIEQFADEDLVFAIDHPHEPGTICGFPCEYTDAEEFGFVGINGEELPQQPLYIIAPATVEDWRRSVRRGGGNGDREEPGRWYYFVRTD